MLQQVLDERNSSAAVHRRVWWALCAGRPPQQVAVRLGTALAIAAMLWLSASAFMVLEPICRG